MLNYKLIRTFKNEKNIVLSSDYSKELDWCVGAHHWDSGNCLVALVARFKGTWSKNHAVRINGQRVG